ncbi:integrase [Actimicrobium sp. GrIS 1.19]|uniref:tyrosine-type recombinase/integrase n=1 Tax=Actimicrobium sp. GrIS 1.19 TaxID=3071708 RepID=UPI002E027189|nr:integrase [Actimicrobium sp. GrIS 1.19]
MSQKKLEINFTKDNIASLPLPETDRVTYHDSHKLASGLQLRIAASGSKTFCVFRRVRGGQPERVTLGRYTDMSIDQARRQAGQINAAIADGKNPAAVKRAHKAEPTFGDLFGEYIRRHAKPNKLTWAEDAQRYEQYLSKPLGNKKLSAIDRNVVASIHSSITLGGHPIVANRVLALVSSVYGWGINVGLCDVNTAKGIKRNRENSRDRFLQGDEFPRFFAALAEETNQTMKDYFLVSLLTGARRANVLSMRWADINFERAEWRIEETKNGTPQTVTLSPEVISILKEREPQQVATFVFPGSGKSGHLMEPKKSWKRILEHAALENLRVHDLRRTLGSWQAKSGASLAIIGKSLNHKNVATTAIYARLDLDPVRLSVNMATSAMMAAGKEKTASSIPNDPTD